jgi:hypothetical protein
MAPRTAVLCLPLLALCCDDPAAQAIPTDTGDKPMVEDDDPPSWDVPPVMVNEFMAYDSPDPDWIEIYNRDTESVDMTGMQLSCIDANTQDTWTFPEGLEIEPMGFLLVFCDEGDDEGDGQLHASFRIERNEGTIYLFDQNASVVNAINYAYQRDGISAARIPDGEFSWDFVDEPTPGESNGTE